MIEEILRDLASREGGCDHEHGEKYKSRVEATDALHKYMQQTAPSVGDYIERNQYGKQMLKFPSDNQAAVLVRKFDEYQVLDGNEAYNGVMIVALRENEFKAYPVDLKYYQKAGQQPTDSE